MLTYADSVYVQRLVKSVLSPLSAITHITSMHASFTRTSFQLDSIFVNARQPALRLH